LNLPSQIIRFKGPAHWVRGPGSAGITLLGTIEEADGRVTAAELSLSGVPSLQLPPVLPDLSVESPAAQDLVLRSGTREWQVRCHTWQLHRDVGASFYAAVPPRRMPWSRRAAWRLMLALAATAPGRWLLARRGRAH
jgi:hypothetical protein